MMTLGSPNSPQGNGQMNAITLASRKGGVGESTLTAHVAVDAHLMGRDSSISPPRAKRPNETAIPSAFIIEVA
jgi:Mrp family chromosome partitioning ATPase